MNDYKNRERITFSIKKELIAQIKQLSKQSRIPQSRLVDEAIELLLRKHQGE